MSEEKITVYLCHECGKKIGASIEAGTVSLEGVELSTPSAEFVELFKGPITHD